MRTKNTLELGFLSVFGENGNAGGSLGDAGICCDCDGSCYSCDTTGCYAC